MNERQAASKPALSRYPHRCHTCGKIAVVPAEIPFTGEVNHDGILHPITLAKVSVVRCSECGEPYFTNESDDQISAALCTKLGLLQPEEIVRRLAELQLTAAELAARLGVTQVQVERLLDGREIQSRVLDKLLRLYFGLPAVREFLAAAAITPVPETAAPV